MRSRGRRSGTWQRGTAATAESIEDMRKLAYELQVHEIELQMQNEALQETNERLDAAQARYRALYEDAPIAYLTLNSEGTVLTANDMALRLLGRKGSDVIGAKLASFVSTEHVPVFSLHRAALQTTSEVVRCKIDLVVGGLTKPVELRSTRAYEHDDAWLVAIVDESVVRELERVTKDYALVSSIFDAAGLLAVLDERGAIVRVSQRGTRSLQLPDVVGKPFWEAFPTTLGGQAARAAFEAAAHARGHRDAQLEWESRLQSADGSLHEIAWSISTVHPGERTWIAIGNDLTEQKRMEAQLMVADRLAAVGALAAGVGHEINNPLAYLLGSIELAQRTASSTEGSVAHRQRMHELLATAHEGATRIRDIVDELRWLARGDHRSIEPIDVRAVVDSCVQIATSELRHRAKLVKTYTEVPLVRGNRGRLGQVFLNLLLNAAQAIPEGRAEENEIRLDIHEQGSGPQARVVVAVTDTGCGISPEHRAHLFDPFFTTKPAGVGLGLSICHSIVSEAGGTIEVDSTPGEGTTVRVLLPATEDTPEPDAIFSDEAVSGMRSRLRVLIVDDEPSLVESLAAMLSDHEVVKATRGAEALKLCAEQDFDVIFCDVEMPEMSGAELYYTLALQHPGLEQRIVLMTGGAFTHGAHELMGRVSNPVLHKPFSMHDALALVERRAMVDQPH